MRTITTITTNDNGSARVTVGMVSLGCSKNQVDAERLLARLKGAGFILSADVSKCDAVIINTCGFIEDAKRESIDAILEFGRLKQNGSLKAVVVTGCLAERYREELASELPEADAVLGIGCNADIVKAVREALSGRRTVAFGDKTALSLEGDRVLAGPGYSAYLKIAEGCDNRCSYCAIPDIRGTFRSRSMESVLSEARTLASGGVRELNVVAQDTTRYGQDNYGALMLPELLTELCKVDGLYWIRLLYCYPQRVTDELLAVIRDQPKIVKYMDIPVQHASGRILKAMNRQGNRRWLTELAKHIRELVPGIALRTTLITGFPGESEREFAELCGFVRDVRFERLGCFVYSPEEDTPAAGFPDQVEREIAVRRAEIIMELQIRIAEEHAAAKKGHELTVLTEGMDAKSGLWYGRSQADAPEIDNRVFFSADKSVNPGFFARVKINSASGCDLVGEMVPARE